MIDDDMTDDPIILSEFGRTSPIARRQACVNMRRDPELVKRMIAQFGEARIRRDYPEVFADEGTGEDPNA